MSGYDPKVHQDFGDLLSTRAKRIPLVYATMAAIVGAGMGCIIALRFPGHRILDIFVATLMMAVFGHISGKERSFQLKLKAQELFWQKQVEENTHGSVASMASGAAAK